MHLRHGEVIRRRIRRHLTPYVLKLVFIGVIVLPLFTLLLLLPKDLDGEWVLVVFAIISIITGMAVTIISMDYLMDKLVVTNKRVVWVNWKTIFTREEREAELLDILDIESMEKGILSKLHIFDYGQLILETAAGRTCIQFDDCADPEGVKGFILEEIEKARNTAPKEPSGEAAKPPKPQEEEEWSVN